MKSLALILGLLVAVQALPAKGPTPLDVNIPVIEGAPVPIPPKIIFGQTAVPGQFPHQAAIVIAGGTFLCGGSLIARNWVLTAARCAPLAIFEVILGRLRWTVPGGFSVMTAERFVHFNFNNDTLANDIALLRLPTFVELTSEIQLVALPTAEDASKSFVDEIALVSGWGYRAPTGAATTTLVWVSLTIINNAACSLSFGNNIIISSTICTIGAGGSGPCTYDSGGALVIYRDGVGYTQIGIVSFLSPAGCASGFPTAYARVTSFRSWIKQITGV